MAATDQDWNLGLPNAAAKILMVTVTPALRPNLFVSVAPAKLPHCLSVKASRELSTPYVTKLCCAHTMPRENRKRGKKHKKTTQDVPQATHSQEDFEEAEPQAGPSWIVPAANTSEFNPEAPFGYVDSEVKAYFRTVDVQIREWQESGNPVADDGDADPNEGAIDCYCIISPC